MGYPRFIGIIMRLNPSVSLLRNSFSFSPLHPRLYAKLKRDSANAHSNSTNSSVNRTTSLQQLIENKDSFLSLIHDASAVHTAQIHAHEKRLISMLDAMGSELGVSPLSAANRSYDEQYFDAKLMSADAQDAVTIRQMLACNMHLGHATQKWHKRTTPFIFGEREGIHVIDLEKTLYYLRKAIAVVREIVQHGGNVLWVAANAAYETLVYDCAMASKQFYINGPWTQGLIRNRELLLGDRKYLPDLVVVFDYATNVQPVLEASKECIPAIAICDTDADPAFVPYPIPANDDAYESVELVAKVLLKAAQEGLAKRTTPYPHAKVTQSAASFAEATEYPNP